MAIKKSKAPRSTRRARSAGAARVQRYRNKQRASGMRLFQMWLPDTSDPAFIAEIRRQCLSLRNDPQEKQILEEIEALSDFESWK